MASIKGRVTGEVYLAFQKLIAFGETKRDLKKSAIGEGRDPWHYFEDKIFSFSALETYYNKARFFAHWCVDKFGIKSVREIVPRMIKSFYTDHLSKLKVNSIKTYLCAITKLGAGIKKVECFRRTSRKIQNSLSSATKVNRPTYHEKQILRVLSILNEDNPTYGLAMQIQLETGCRLIELERLRPESLLGLEIIDGEEQGIIQLVGKGGRLRKVLLFPATYSKLQNELLEKRKWLNRSGFRSAVFRANQELDLKHGGTHKARRYSVQQSAKILYKELRKKGIPSHEARLTVLHEANRILGHSPERTSTTTLYLRK